jgi:acetyl-CoA acetyltransferase
MCETVLCVLGNHRNPTPLRSPNRNPAREFDTPFGASGANTSYALLMQAHMAKYGSTPADYAQIAVGARANAQLNPMAIFHGKPANIDDILESPMITSPLHLLEIVMPVAGGEAVIVTSGERAAKGPHRSVGLWGAGEKITHRAVSQAPNLTSGPLKPSIERALIQAGLTAQEMDFLSLYDCYTIMVATTIEDAGLCPPGGFGNWIRDNGGMGPDARQPINTHGGQLGFGQPDLAGGMSHVVEAVRQLRGDASGRQIQGCRTALVTGNGATMSEAVALVLGVEA